MKNLTNLLKIFFEFPPRYLDNFNFIWKFDFMLAPIFVTSPDAQINTNCFKSGQKWQG